MADDFLTAVKTVQTSSKNDETPLKEVTTGTKPSYVDKEHVNDSILVQEASTPDDVLSILQSQPSTESLLQVLKWLRSDHADFDICTPGPIQAQIINTLVNTIVPTFWSSLGGHIRSSLISCLRSLAGCSAVMARVKKLSDDFASRKPSPGQLHELIDLHDVAIALFAKDDCCLNIYLSLKPTFKNYGKAQMGWKEFVNLAGTGKITAAIARSEDILSDNEQRVNVSWIASGSEYVNWLGRCTACIMATFTNGRPPTGGMPGAAASLFAKSLSIGYPLPLVKGLITALIRAVTRLGRIKGALYSFVKDLPSFARRTFLESSLRWLSAIHTLDDLKTPAESQDHSNEVSAIAAVIDLLASSPETLQRQLFSFVSDPVLASSASFATRRACVAVLSYRALDDLQELLEQMMKSFGDTLFINHAPILQQETLAQTLLLVTGYLHRSDPMAVLVTARSTNHMQGVSNRLESSNQAARWLGMIVATAISSLVDKEGSKMSFGTEDMQTEKAQSYMAIVMLNDHIGTLQDFDHVLKSKESIVMSKQKPIDESITSELPVIDGKRAFGPERPPAPVQTEVIGEKISEMLDEDDEDEDDDLKPYAKPDSDPEDSDEDATLVNRNKIRAPVYIRDLMRMLKDDKDHDRFQMGIKHAATLVRRKTDFGREVKDHAEELALTLCDLQDPFETDDFDELRLQGLIAVLLSNVALLAPWLAKQTFSGDYSLSQRCLMLSALGLGGRELAGFKQDDLNPVPHASSIVPSKRLNNRLHAIYSPADPSVKKLEAASQSTSNQLIKPLALLAADETTSHLNAVKVRTFSSRMDVERTKRSPAPNQLAKIAAADFFDPLISRFYQDIAAYGDGSVFKTPFVLVTFIKTLAILLHAAGPAMLELGDVTMAFWELLLSLRVQALSDISVLEAVLFGLLTLLETNDGAKQRLAQSSPKQLMETQQWVEMVFERTGGGELVVDGSGEEARVRTLAAGVLVKIRDVFEMHQKLLVGYS